MSLTFFPGLTSNHDPCDLYLLSSWDYRHEPLPYFVILNMADQHANWTQHAFILHHIALKSIISWLICELTALRCLHGLKYSSSYATALCEDILEFPRKHKLFCMFIMWPKPPPQACLLVPLPAGTLCFSQRDGALPPSLWHCPFPHLFSFLLPVKVIRIKMESLV
jgi:hypothetical protein